MSQQGRNVIVVRSGTKKSDLACVEIYRPIAKALSAIEKALFAAYGLCGSYRSQRWSWKRFAIRTAEDLILRYGPETVELYCTYPVAEVVEAGLELKRRYPGIHLTVEFRDGLYTEAIEGPKTRYLHGVQTYYKRLEETALKEADTIISVSAVLSALLQETGRGRTVLTAMNGYEAPAKSAQRDEGVYDLQKMYPGRRIVLHSGSVVRKEENFLALCDTVSSLNADKASRTLLVQMGEIPSAIRRFALSNYPDCLVCMPAVARDRVLEYQKTAHALVILNLTGETRKGVLTGKLFEYLFAGVPIMSFLPGTEAADVIARTGTGLSVGRDPAEAHDALNAILSGRFVYAPKNLDDYLFRNQMRRLGEYWHG